MTNLSQNRKPNRLQKESSPYLLQHACNPVDWYPWGDEALEKARAEQKLMIVSIGYSACHWCHVMEHQSFEDEQVAQIMNDLFICVKVDREERPDIDQVYMAAVQIMTGQGGWPLNCFTLPDGRPLYGGTYFPKEKWISALINLADLWKNEPEQCMQYAHELTEGVKQLENIVPEFTDTVIQPELIHRTWHKWSERIDTTEGGPNRAPKFPLPNNYLFLLRYAHYAHNETVLNYALLTLDKMAMGGIYDHIGGGFARYSTDVMWKVPHFEKMLYDNAQLVSLYSEAYAVTGKQFYREVVDETLAWISREMTTQEGAFYSALDADSEGVEGKYYIWKKEELQEHLSEDFNWFADLYNVNSIGYWVDHGQTADEGNYIPLMREAYSVIAGRHSMTESALKDKVMKAKMALHSVRSRRVKPGLDDKILTSWNAMMLRGYTDAWKVTGDAEYLLAAEKNAKFIYARLLKKDGSLWHVHKNGKSSVNGFLEDYAFVIDAFISLYQCRFDEKYLMTARDLMNHALEKFPDDKSPLLYFTSSDDKALIARKKELSDNVIPASNSMMALNLHQLGRYFGSEEWLDRSATMLKCVEQDMIGYGQGYSNWLILALHRLYPSREVVIVGKDVDKTAAGLRKCYLPNEIFAGSTGQSDLPLFRNRGQEGITAVYICENNTCKLPVFSPEEALEQLK